MVIDPRISGDERERLLQGMLNDHELNGGRVAFKLIRDGELVEVVPTAVRGPGGKLEPFEAMMDTKSLWLQSGMSLVNSFQRYFGKSVRYEGYRLRKVLCRPTCSDK
jgi:hypothetical protein